jgi:hypothetical protein
MWKYVFILFGQISNLDLLLNKIAQNLPSLQFLSLLGNAASPSELSDPDKDEEGYQRYRYWLLLLDFVVVSLPCKIPKNGLYCL